MKAVVVEGPGQLAVREVPVPTVGPYQALVKIEACSICNSTDTKIIDRHFVSHIPVPLVLGHESVGTIVELGPQVRTLQVGQRVLRPGAEYDWGRVGIASAWGGFAEYGLATDLASWQEDNPSARPNGMWAKQQQVPAGIPAAEATAIITLKEALVTVRSAGVGPGTWVAIVGSGPVARAFTFWATRLGAAFVVAFGRQERWCHDFLDLGANNYVAGDRPCLEDEAKNVGVSAFDLAFDAVGTNQALEDALALTRSTGSVCAYGVAPEDDVVSPAVLAARQAGRIVTPNVQEELVHEEVLGMVASGEVQLGRWFSHVLPLQDIHEGLRLLRGKSATKVVIEF